MEFNLRDNTILLTVAGSRAYGIHSSTSDVDVKGVAIPPMDYFLGFAKVFEQADKASHMENFLDLMNKEEFEAIYRDKIEGSIYELRKFMKLPANGNPNILDALFCRDQEVRLCTKAGETLRANRDLFLSRKLRWTFSGYAHSQLNRINTHRRWLLFPPKAQPTRKEFSLPERTVIPPDQLSAAQAAIRQKIDSWEIDFLDLEEDQKLYIKRQIIDFLSEASIGASEKFLAAGRLLGYSENFLELLEHERRYKAAKDNWVQYNEWLTNRNPERAALEAKCGLDSKHGAHLIRLYRMGVEALETGKVHVWRGNIDAEELKEIRHGNCTYEGIVEEAKQLEERLVKSYEVSPLPFAPDRNSLDKICISLVKEYNKS